MLYASETYAQAEQGTFVKPKLFITIGNYEVPEGDILSPGAVTLSRPYDFSDISAGDYSLVLDNSSGKYSPNKPSTWIFEGQDWYRKTITVEMGLNWESTGTEEKVKLFEGLVLEWINRRIKSPESDSPIEEESVEIVCRDVMSTLMEQVIGGPDSDGEANPLVYGSVIKPAKGLGDRIFWAVDTTCDFEEGDVTDFDSTASNGSATIAASSTYAHAGTYSAKVTTTDAVDDYAYGVIDLSGSAKTEAQLTGYVRFDTIPANPGHVTPYQFGFMNSANTPNIWVAVYNTSEIGLAVYGAGYIGSGVIVDDLEDKWVKFSLVVDCANPGTARLYLDGDLIAKYDGNLAALTMAKCWVGAYTVASGNPLAWQIYWDDVQVTETIYPEGYFLPGAAFTSIDAAYRDGIIIPKELPPLIKWTWKEGRTYSGYNLMRFSYAKGVSSDIYTASATHGIVNFTDYNDPPSGTVLIGATKNTTTHPADIIDGILDEVNLTDYIDTVSFANAKTDNANDEIGGYFDNVMAIDAVREICAKTLYDLYMEAGEIKLKPYLGVSSDTWVKDINASHIIEIEENIDMQSLTPKVVGKWGWWELDNAFYYEAEDTEVSALIGDISAELNFTYSENVSSNSETMVTEKVDNLLTRLSKPRNTVRILGTLELARIELGDTVRVDFDWFYDAPVKFEIIEKTIDFLTYTVELIAVRFIGEYD